MKPNDIFSALKSSPRTSRVVFPVRNARMLAEKGSPFSGKYTPDNSKAYVEFDICHSLPCVTEPPQVGLRSGFHPAALSRSHEGLRHQQTNLNHMLRAYDPTPDKKTIPHDRIIGAVIDTHYPPPPEGGWVIPESEADAVPMHVLGVVFKAADGAMEMLNNHVEKKETWSVSIECTARSLEDLGIWIPDKRELVPLLQADDALLEKVSKDSAGRIQLGDDDSGNPLALCFGAIDGYIIFEGVGYTTMPAETLAEITKVRLSAAGIGKDEFQLASSLRRNWPSIWKLTCRLNGLPSAESAFSMWSSEVNGGKGQAIEDWKAARLKASALLDAIKGPQGAVTRLKWGLATQSDKDAIAQMKARIYGKHLARH